MKTACLLIIYACIIGCTENETDTSKKIIVHVDEVFTIKLQANHTTQYKWALLHKPGLVDPISYNYISDKGGIGAGGMDHWTFRAIKKGEDSIKFVLTRENEVTSASPVRSFYIEVRE
ncbi:MAG: protease inhibitor I42 family protein [Candidatus Dadabacteria bacterium]